MKKQVVVLGMHRSGTSTIALILQALGVNMGTRLLGANSGNPYGHAEDLEFLELHERMLKSVRSSWDFPPNKRNLEKSFFNNIKEINTLINSKNNNLLWGWKEPRTTLYAECYHGLLDNPYYICVKRDNMKVAKSLKERTRMPIKKGMKLCEKYNNELDSFIKNHQYQNVLLIQFSDLHNISKDITSQLINFLELNPTEEQIEDAKRIIKPLNTVRGNRERLKKNENKIYFIKAIKNPIKAINIIYIEVWRHLKYYLGV